MKKPKKQMSVAGVVAPGPRPTPLAAALVATAVTFPFLIAVVIYELVT